MVRVAVRSWGDLFAVGLSANVPEDAISIHLYPLDLGDETGKLLDGANNYTLNFDKASVPPVNAFWSVTLYDTEGSTSRMH
jgi:hypothetical protein